MTSRPSQLPPFAGRAAVVGVGWTPFSKASGVTVGDLATTCVLDAVADAGLQLGDVDGLLSYAMNDSVPVLGLARSLGLDRLRWHQDMFGGGTQAASILGDAAMVIDAGLADVVVIYRALNGRSGKRMGQVAVGHAEDAHFYGQYGLAGPVQLYALAAQRHLHETGQTDDDLGAVAVELRAHALRNPRALMRTPLTLEDHHASPMVATPLRRFDCCQETDGGCALVVTSTERARSLPHPPVTIRSVVRGGGPGCSALDRAEHIAGVFSQYLADDLWRTAGMRPADVDLAQLYDAYTWVVLRQLEDLGFCPPGESGAFVRDGGLRLDGATPTNTNGGLLSEAYVHGLNNVAEAVVQLRHEAGDRQVPEAQVALCTGFGGSFGTAAVLTREDA
jgi:acetyl-CoA acetyltransferase